MVHGSSKKSVVFPHKIEDLDEFTTQLITYWTVNYILRADMDYKLERIEKLTNKLEG